MSDLFLHGIQNVTVDDGARPMVIPPKNKNLTQNEVAQLAWISRRTVLNAEKGDVRLADLIAILQALDLVDHLNLFLPEPPLSPIQLLKLRGKLRKRASGKTEKLNNKSSESLDW